MESYLLDGAQADMPVSHQFCNGLYARTMFLRSGTAATGGIHKDESFFVVRKGSLLVEIDKSEINNTMVLLFGPYLMAYASVGFMCVTRPNTKRFVMALSDVEITTFHPNPENETRDDVLWDMFTLPNDLQSICDMNISKLGVK